MKHLIRFRHCPFILGFLLFAGNLLQAQSPSPITFESGTLPAGAVNTPYSFTFTGTDACNGSPSPDITFSSSDIPSWLAFDSSSTVLFGTPTTAGLYSFHVTATENNCTGQNIGPTTLPFSITVTSPSQTFYVLDPGPSALSVDAINGSVTTSCPWAQETDPCFGYTDSFFSDFAVDAANNFLIPIGNSVLKFPLGGSTVTQVASFSQLPGEAASSANFASLAVDSAGNYIIADNGNNMLWLYPAGGGTALPVGSIPSSTTFEDVFVRIVSGSPGSYIVAEDGGVSTNTLQLYRFTACQPSPASCPGGSPTPLIPTPPNNAVKGLAVSGSNYVVTLLSCADCTGSGTIMSVPFSGGQPTTFNAPVPGVTIDTPFGIFPDVQTGNLLYIDANSLSMGPATLNDLSSGPNGSAGIGQVFQFPGGAAPAAVLTIPPVISVAPAPPPPLVLTGTLSSGFAYESYSASVSASGGVGPYTFSVTGLPAGLTLNQYSGAITGTPTTTGSFSVTATVTDSQPVSASVTFTLTISAPPPVAVPGGTLTSTVVGTPLSLTLSATGGGPPYIWSLASGSLPTGLTLQSFGTLSGTPLVAGNYSFGARATDTFGGAAVGSFTLTVLPKPLTTSSTTSTLPAGMVGVTYQPVSVTASGGNPPYTCALTTGSLPAGLTLASDCVISGTPTAATPSAGVTITVTVSDSSATPSTGTATYSIAVAQYQPDLILSSGSLSFSLAIPTSNLPQSQTVQVQSSDVKQTLGFSLSIAPASATWLSVTPNGTTTPSSFAIGLTSAALSLASSATPYTATVTATCTSNQCVGSQHTVSVSLSVTSAPPQLSVLTTLLAFNTQSAGPQITTQSLGVSNTGGGSIGFGSVACGASWCSVSGVPGSIGAGASAQLTVTANPDGLSPGYYFTDVSIVSSGGKANVPVTLFIASNGTISLGPAGAQFTLPQGGEAVGNTSFLVSIAGSQAVTFNAAVSPSVPWLSVTQSGATASGTQPATVNLVFDQTQVAALAAGVYYATVEVTSGASANSPQSFEVVLNVTPAAQETTPNPVPGGLIYLTQATLTPPGQTVNVYTGSTSAITYQASATTNKGGNWLTVSPIVGTTSAGTSGQSTVTANPSGLAPGVYTGNISYQFSATAVRSVNVTMVVENVTSTPSPSVESALRPAAASACAASQIVPTSTSLVSNFAAPAAWPIELAVNLVDDCGSPLNNGQIVATFSNGDPPLILALTDVTGDFVGTWTPQHASNQITVNALATSPGLPNAALQLAGAVTSNNAPILANLAIANFYNPIGGAPLAPGALVQITGQYLSGQTLNASTIPLPSTLGGTSVIIGGLPAPLSMVSPGQLNAQVPFELPPGQPYQVIVNANNALTTPQSFQAGAASPGLSVLPSGYVQANHQSGAAVTEAAPAKPGEYISVYLVGMGATTITVGSGQPGPGAPYATTVVSPVITLNNESVSFNFSGLIPGLVGVYQVNLQVPSDAPNGDLTLAFSQNGFASNSGLLPVHN